MNDIIRQKARRIFRKIESVRIEKGQSWSEIRYLLKVMGYDIPANETRAWVSGKSDSFITYISHIACALGVPDEVLTDIED